VEDEELFVFFGEVGLMGSDQEVLDGVWMKH
jgi:hypothetical protein